MTDFCEYIYCKGEFSQPLIIYEKLDFKKLTREKIPLEPSLYPLINKTNLKNLLTLPTF